MNVRNRFEERVARKLEALSLGHDHTAVVDHINRVMSPYEFLRTLSMAVDEALAQAHVEAVIEAQKIYFGDPTAQSTEITTEEA